MTLPSPERRGGFVLMEVILALTPFRLLRGFRTTAELERLVAALDAVLDG